MRISQYDSPVFGAAAPPSLFQDAEFDETGAQLSPDGRLVAYHSNESGSNEVYIRAFSLASDGKPEATAKHQILTGGGSVPHWRGDGKELVSRDRRTVMSAEIAAKQVFQSSAHCWKRRFLDFGRGVVLQFNDGLGVGHPAEAAAAPGSLFPVTCNVPLFQSMSQDRRDSR